MNDRMLPLSFDQLMHWILSEQGATFGIRQRFKKTSSTALQLFNETLELPFGPAAGPHTQLAQNIIAAYVAGARFFELKTVQTLDGEALPVAKPCITANDECYNVEWSTELTVSEAFEEYTKAWFALKLLSKEWGLGDPNGFIFNMSVGYDLEGISSPKIDAYLNAMQNAQDTSIWQTCTHWALANLGRFQVVDAAYIQSISPHVSRSVTLSTLHGCPPSEIERIATYLLTKKQLHTFIKCNPTLLGYEKARRIMDQMGYDYLLFDDHHFKNDLQFVDAVPMLKRLKKLATEHQLAFGVKLTNTFPVQIGANELPGTEMYMSGRPLFPLTIAVAEKLSEAFDGQLPISFSGGADATNIATLLAAGIYPVTLATTLLKPGGYERLTQMATMLQTYIPPQTLQLDKIHALAQGALTDPYYLKPIKPLPSRKSKASVPLIDCTVAPCHTTCPIHQDIPRYIRLCEEGKYEEALQVITADNPLPFMTGTLCNHRCMDSCRRNFYESPLAIRQLKLQAAQEGFSTLLENLPKPTQSTSQTVAIVGGGPAGLAAAYFLGRAGVPTTLFEKRDHLGGVVKHIIPSFRIDKDALEKDIAVVKHYGVNVQLNHTVQTLAALQTAGYAAISLATGATTPATLQLEKGSPQNVLHFLEQAHSPDVNLQLGKHVIVIGGGNTAMDAARTAKRQPGVETVSIVYRRTKRYMPADQEELTRALEEGILLRECLAPIRHEHNKLHCEIMQLGPSDVSGRRSPVATGAFISLDADTVIAAIGDQIDTAFFKHNHLPLTDKGKPHYDPLTKEVADTIFIAGDTVTGPATIVEAIRDARQVSDVILSRLHLSDPHVQLASSSHLTDPYLKKGVLVPPTTPDRKSVV